MFLVLLASCSKPSPVEQRRRLLESVNERYRAGGVLVEAGNSDATQLRTVSPCGAIDAGMMRSLSGQGFSFVECAGESGPTKRELSTAIPPEPPKPRVPTPACNPQEKAARERWLVTGNADAHGASARDEGFRLEGACSEMLLSRGLSCDEETVRTVDGASPWLSDAARLGVTTFICEVVPGGEAGGKRVPYPIATLLAR